MPWSRAALRESSWIIQRQFFGLFDQFVEILDYFLGRIVRIVRSFVISHTKPRNPLSLSYQCPGPGPGSLPWRPGPEPLALLSRLSFVYPARNAALAFAENSTNGFLPDLLNHFPFPFFGDSIAMNSTEISVFPMPRLIAFSTSLSVRAALIDFLMTFLATLTSFLLAFFFAIPHPRRSFGDLSRQSRITFLSSMSRTRALFQRRPFRSWLGLWFCFLSHRGSFSDPVMSVSRASIPSVVGLNVPGRNVVVGYFEVKVAHYPGTSLPRRKFPPPSFASLQEGPCEVMLRLRCLTLRVDNRVRERFW
jgi:hypothetical protein